MKWKIMYCIQSVFLRSAKCVKNQCDAKMFSNALWYLRFQKENKNRVKNISEFKVTESYVLLT